MAIAILFLGLMALGAVSVTQIRKRRRGAQDGGDIPSFLPITENVWEWTLALVLGLVGVIVLFEVSQLWR